MADKDRPERPKPEATPTVTFGKDAKREEKK